MQKKQDITPRNGNGERHGDWIEYYSDSQLDYKGSYINGEQHGEWVRYWDNGELHYKGEYNNGKRVGMWKQWNYNTKEYDNVFYG